MSQITIQCRLVAKEATRQTLWQLMAELNTPFINELLQQVAQYPDFEQWRQRGRLTAKVIEQLGNELKKDPRFLGQPARFYTSGISLVEYIFKSWLKLQQRLQRKLDGKRRWLEVLKSDEQLIKDSQTDLETIRQKATEILQSYEGTERLFNSLFQAYRDEQNILTQTALNYLLKNRCQLPKKPEDAKKFAKRRRKVEITIKRLQKQINGRLPQGRDLTNDNWLETLNLACDTDPKDVEQSRTWQDKLLKKSQSIPFPINYETNEDLTWSKNEKGRFCVQFNGISDLKFEIYCDQRQLKWIQRFYEDQQVKKDGKDQHSSGLFTLRSGRILWQEGKGKGELWDIHRLTLQCTLETRCWTHEGTEQVKQEKADEIAGILTRMNEKGDLTKNQKAFVRRKQSTLNRLEKPFPRPSQPLYQGKSNILVGVSMELKKPATIAVIDGVTRKVLTYRNIKQLLGKNYPLLNRQQRQKQRQSHQRNIAQRKEAFNQFGDSELGQHIDRLLAKAIISIAQKYQAGSIVVPKLEDIREATQSEIQAKAEAKIPNCIEAQAEYAKKYRMQVHEWSYGRLIDNIQAQASKLGIFIEESQQPLQGTPLQKAAELAFKAYRSRLSA
ncbi:type V CRISPR-associated protein Cas12k [Crocosphaera chwakensis]|uniref:Uncharacterized protein n=1 Tax=Crocosphaera chwakensis CCY0110 TaxID=391612 RepID=A3IT92_9CHRO|nr:type V CRISPR-associated protein Cas12k [Crocosphaera chwakensis]EAZ90277.1 hypothetical protein CY0110_04111 [Crocosphaera chwakensis CCY0110]